MSLNELNSKKFFCIFRKNLFEFFFCKVHVRDSFHIILLVLPRGISAKKNLVCTMFSHKTYKVLWMKIIGNIRSSWGIGEWSYRAIRKSSVKIDRRSGKITLDFVPATPVSRIDSGFNAVFYRNPLPPNGKCCKIELRLAHAYTSCLASGNPQLCLQEVFFL